MADIPKQTWVPQNDQFQRFVLTNGETGAVITAGTFAATLYAADGVTVAVDAGAIPYMQNVPAIYTGANGLWKVPITDAFNAPPGDYVCIIKGDSDTGATLKVEFKVGIKARKG